MIKKNTQLCGDGFFLQKLSNNNLSKNYFNWFKDKAVKRFIKSKYKSKEYFFKETLQEINKKNQLFLGIFIKKKDHIGNIKYHNIDRVNKSAWVGILIGEKKFRNRNFGKKAMHIACRYLFENYGISNFYLKVNYKNINAINSYKKNGFNIIKKRKNEFLMYLNFKYNQFILGTAQFGEPYGITGSNRRLSKRKILSILKFSKKKITEIDCAEDYNIKDIIKYKFKKFKVNTKINYSLFNKPFTEIKNFLKKINSKYKINVLFVRELENNFKNKIVLRNILKLKRNKLINKIGISIYSTKNIKKLYKIFKYDVIQAPINILDNRCDKFENFFINNNIEVHARSVFLQGLFFLKKINNPKLKIYKSLMRNFLKKRQKLKLSVYDLALSHVFEKKYVNKIIIGVHDVKQLSKCINFKFKKKIQMSYKLEKSHSNFLDPRKW